MTSSSNKRSSTSSFSTKGNNFLTLLLLSCCLLLSSTRLHQVHALTDESNAMTHQKEEASPSLALLSDVMKDIPTAGGGDHHILRTPGPGEIQCRTRWPNASKKRRTLCHNKCNSNIKKWNNPKCARKCICEVSCGPRPGLKKFRRFCRTKCKYGFKGDKNCQERCDCGGDQVFPTRT